MASSVRQATESDFPALLELGRLMHAEAVNLNHAAFDDDAVIGSLRMAMTSGLLLVHEAQGEIDAGFAGIKSKRWYSKAPAFVDLALFVRPDRRAGLIAWRLLMEVKSWCKAQGIDARDVMLGITTGVHESSTARLYEHVGLVRAGSIYQLGSY